LGIYDLSGNVFHWCWDEYNEDFLEKNKGRENPLNEKSKEKFRPLRGGSWYDGADVSRVAFLGRGHPALRYNYFGFGLVFGLQFTTTEHSKQVKKKQE